MKGFLKRDFYLMLPNLKFFAVILGCFAMLVVFTDFQVTFLGLYAVVFSMSAVMSLFSYDDANHWPAYAAAIPGGRRRQVDGRYALSALLCAAAAGLMAAAALLGSDAGGLGLAVMYGGVCLVYIDVTLPLFYKFGGTKGRTLMVVMVALIAGIVGAGGAIAGITGKVGGFDFGWLPVPVLAVGLGGLVISRGLSIAIMEHKEF